MTLHKKEVFAFLAFLSCFMALLMTGSRAGVVVSMATFVAAFILFFQNDLPKRNGLAWLIVSATGVALLSLQILGGHVNQRFDTQSLSDEGRLEGYRSTLHMISGSSLVWHGSRQFCVELSQLPKC